MVNNISISPTLDYKQILRDCIDLPKNRFEEMAILSLYLNRQIEAPKESLFYKRWNTKNADGEYVCSTRAYFIAKAYQYIMGCSFWDTMNNDELINLILVGEYCITLMYLENHFYDRKYGVVCEESQRENRKERNQLARGLYHFIKDNFTGKIQKRVLWYIKRLFRLYYKGFYLDDRLLTYRNFRNNSFDKFTLDRESSVFIQVKELMSVFQIANHKKKKYTPFEKEEYLNLYLSRTYLINGVFFQTFAELLIEGYGSQARDYSNLLRFARIYGLVQQLVNDNFDYLPVGYKYTTLCKLAEDTFSDSRRRLMTLPLMCYFNLKEKPMYGLSEHYSGSLSLELELQNNTIQEIVLDKLIESGAMGQAMSLAAQIATYGESLLDKDQSGANFLNDMFSFAKSNKYYKAYNRRKKQSNGVKNIHYKLF